MPLLAQIDLAALAGVSGLPGQGALVVFVGNEGCFAEVFSAAQMLGAVEIAPPADSAPIRDLGFFGAGIEFGHWPVDPLAFVDRDGGRPDVLPNPFATPGDWLTTRGLARLEAELCLAAVRMRLEISTKGLAHVQAQQAAGKQEKWYTTALVFHAAMQQAAPALIETMTEWHGSLAEGDPLGPVDRAGLARNLAQRLELLAAIGGEGPQMLLQPDPQAVWDRLVRLYPGLTRFAPVPGLPEAFHAFVASRISDWRGHRVFGRPEGGGGLAALIEVRADDLLGTGAEHYDAVSVWCDPARLARGDVRGGKYLRHGTV